MEVVLSGYYGYGNAGDEAMLVAIREGLGRGRPDLQFTVISGNPAATRRQHGVNAIGRTDFAGIRRAIARSSLVLSGGGSLLQDVTGPLNIPYYLGIIGLARLHRRPVMLYAQGIGPINRAVGRRLLPLVLNGVDRISTRDAASAELLRSLGVRRPPIEVTADATLALRPSRHAAAEAVLAEHGVIRGRQPIIGFSIRPWEGAASPDRLAAVAERLIGDLDAQLVFIPMQEDEDGKAIRQVVWQMERRPHILKDVSSPESLLQVVGGLDLVVGMRLHALIFAAMMHVPMIGLTYDPKVDHFLELLDWERPYGLDHLDPAGVVSHARDLLERRECLSRRLADRLPALRQQAERNHEIALSLL